MKGRINYKPGGLVQITSYSDLPEEGSESAIYYVRDENSYYSYNKLTKSYTGIRSRANTWFIESPSTSLNNEEGKTSDISSESLTNLESGEALLTVGDMVYDCLGQCGIIIKISTGLCTIQTLESSVSRKVKYEDGSWEMWGSKGSTVGGHYYWESSNNVLTFEGVNTEQDTTIAWESYSVIGGGSEFETSGGTRKGVRRILAWDGEHRGEGILRFYYTKDMESNVVTENNEVATLEDVYSILMANSGIYLGHCGTLTQLENGDIEGYPDGHILASNDWVYVYHCSDNIKQYMVGESYLENDIVEYSGRLYIVINPFIATEWVEDSKNTQSWDGETWTYVYRNENGWTKGTLVEEDNFEPDEEKLTTTRNNKMTIKDGGVDTAALADQSVTANKLATASVTTEKIADKQVTREKFDDSLQELMRRADTMWYSENFIISPEQPPAPEDGYIIWINSSTESI